MGMSRDTSSTVLCGNVSEYLSRTTFSEIYEPEWDSVSRNRANNIQAGQSEYPISYRNGPMTQVKPISVVSGPGALEGLHSSQGSLAFRDHLSRTWQSQPENEAEAQKRNKHRTKSGNEYFSPRGRSKKRVNMRRGECPGLHLHSRQQSNILEAKCSPRVVVCIIKFPPF